MRMTGEQAIMAPRQKVWEALNDPEVLRQCIPGCESLVRESDDRLAAVAAVRIGPIGARFKGTVTLADLDPGNGYTIHGAGSGGIAGSAKGNAKVRLSDHGGGTLVSWEVEAEVGGRMAQLGGPVIDATARQMAGKFFAKFGEVVSGGKAPAMPATVAGTAAVPAVATSFPWAWTAALGLAVLAGFVLGREGLAPGWAVAAALLAIGSAAAGRLSR